MSDYEIHGVRTAALLHDIGQLAVPDHILSKPGPLTHEEFDRIRTHPEVGAEIIAQVPFPYPVAPLILGHHERWDGYGYPGGLKGEQIPLGARILSVVDYFDALISDRPYHSAMPHDAAIRLLQQESGRALDPIAVARFVELLPRLLSEDEQAAKEAPAETSGRTVFDDIALAHREVYTLYEIAHAMGTSLSVSETMELIASKLTRLVPFSCCALFLADEDEGELRCRFASGLDADVIRRLAVKLGAGVIGRVGPGKPVVNGLPAIDLEASRLTLATSLRSSLVCPLVRNEALIGAIALYDTLPRRYAENHARLLMRVAEQASAVVSNSVMFERTQVDSLTDPLTGLPNMRSLSVHAARELARAARLQAEVSLLVLDIDHFKDINDRYGHHVGDRALREVGGILRDAVRPYDICARYAGDEFVILLPGCGLEEAERKREELQAAVACHRLEPDEGGPIALSISCGAAVFPADGHSYESLLARADSRMYRDKGERRRHARRAAHAEAQPPAAREREEVVGRR
jgi:diguanylate cyclase (GGDEF)-like protein